MTDIIQKVRNLKSKLSNPGEENSIVEVGWNDLIYEQIEELLKDDNSDIANKIRLNHI